MKSTCRLTSALLLVVLLTGCETSLVRLDGAPEQHSYVLEWEPTAPPPTPASDARTLLISPPLARAPYSSSDMLYMNSAFEMNRYAYHRWADSPAHMLEPLLLQAAENSGLFRRVVSAGNRVLTDLRLDTRLQHLRQVLSGDQCRVELAVRIELSEVASATPLGAKLFRYAEPCEPASAETGVAAANRAVARFLEDLQATLEDLVRKRNR